MLLTSVKCQPPWRGWGLGSSEAIVSANSDLSFHITLLGSSFESRYLLCLPQPRNVRWVGAWEKVVFSTIVETRARLLIISTDERQQVLEWRRLFFLVWDASGHDSQLDAHARLEVSDTGICSRKTQGFIE